MAEDNGEQELERLRSLEKTLLLALDIVSDGIWDWHRLTGIVKRNARWYQMLGYEPFSLPETVNTWLELIHPDDYPATMAAMQRYLDGEAPLFSARYRFKKADGDYIWLQDQARFVEFDEHGEPVRMLGAHQDIHHQVQAEEEQRQHQAYLEQLNRELERKVQERTRELAEANTALVQQLALTREQARTDYLTGLFNRRHFDQVLNEQWQQAARQVSAIVLLDLDYFKEVNDRHGHQIGDLVLQTIPELLRPHLRHQDLLARWGGEEFILWLPDTSGPAAMHLSERLRHTLAEARFCRDIHLTASFGVAVCRPGDTIQQVLRRADACLYRAKRERNKVAGEVAP
ncbi:sensor domain-containing diguanylate cyclase [Zobellella iuensis]|uniref:diguanylate cyclase n=1 Tax=Zobellella iuensis TaxID=2803811 RepID=A0ABS1QTA1_9GAMM|nr:sensor domain-containing diguanylate cyclase [Zobellella iuensis]MBL1378075.1 diguanylate cyclase [Zobellella iuensis]